MTIKQVQSGVYSPRDVRGISAPAEDREMTTSVSNISTSVIKKTAEADGMRPTLRKLSSNVQPAAITEQLAALTGECDEVSDN